MSKNLVLHETQMTKRGKTSELKKVTAAIRPFYFQMSQYFLKFVN